MKSSLECLMISDLSFRLISQELAQFVLFLMYVWNAES